MDLDGSALRAVTDLTLALDRECRLIEELRRAVLQQREAVERGDVAGVESSIRLAGRSLLTLQENQRHRSTLLRRLVGDPAQPLAELDERFDSALPAAFLAAREKMRVSASDVAAEVWRNQEVLLAALRERDAMLQELLTGMRPSSAGDRPGATPED